MLVVLVAVLAVMLKLMGETHDNEEQLTWLDCLCAPYSSLPCIIRFCMRWCGWGCLRGLSIPAPRNAVVHAPEGWRDPRLPLLVLYEQAV